MTMRPFRSAVLCALLALPAAHAAAQESIAARDARTSWWRDARFGMFSAAVALATFARTVYEAFGASGEV